MYLKMTSWFLHTPKLQPSLTSSSEFHGISILPGRRMVKKNTLASFFWFLSSSHIFPLQFFSELSQLFLPTSIQWLHITSLYPPQPMPSSFLMLNLCSGSSHDHPLSFLNMTVKVILLKWIKITSFHWPEPSRQFSSHSKEKPVLDLLRCYLSELLDVPSSIVDFPAPRQTYQLWSSSRFSEIALFSAWNLFSSEKNVAGFLTSFRPLMKSFIIRDLC